VEVFKYVPYLQDSFKVNVARIVMSENRLGYAFTLQKENGTQHADKRSNMGRKLIFELSRIYKDIIAVEIRKDTFYNFFTKEMANQHSYSMDFVLKWLSKLHLDDKQKFLECFDINFLQNDYMNGVKKKEIDFRYRTHEGSYHCMNAMILFEYNMSKEATAYILFKDVEQLRSSQLEEQRKMRDSLLAARSSAELKGEVLANISHEIRTPMSGIVSMSSVAKQVYKQEDKLLECLSNIDEYAERMMQVMDSLLDMVKVSDHTITIAKQPFHLEHFLNRIDIAVRSTIEKKNVQFRVEKLCQYNQVLGDEIRLYQAVSTLIQNAISYTPISGSITLTVKQIAADMKTVYIRFIIEDTGNGLTDKMKESIFGFQHNVDEGLIDEEHFDLSLAAKIIRLMGGDIGVAVGEKGTKLYFTLPFELHEEEKDKPIKKKTAPAADYFKGKRVLLAEDSEMGQDALRAVLEVVGFEVDTVENGKKAVISFVSQPAFTYDVILMDVHMPYMDGREATRCIRISGKEDGESVPVIGLMANTYEEDIKESIAAGMQAHLAKPVDVDKLYRVLGKVIPEKEE
jgi:signal transduction histidine kinase/ActR/RegA family two-component response regulator